MWLSGTLNSRHCLLYCLQLALFWKRYICERRDLVLLRYIIRTVPRRPRICVYNAVNHKLGIILKLESIICRRHFIIFHQDNSDFSQIVYKFSSLYLLNLFPQCSTIHSEYSSKCPNWWTHAWWTWKAWISLTVPSQRAWSTTFHQPTKWNDAPDSQEKTLILVWDGCRHMLNDYWNGGWRNSFAVLSVW